MTDREIVERVAALLNRAVVRLRRRKAHHKRPYATVIKGSPAVSLMVAARPFLGSAQQDQIDRAIGSWHGRPARWRRPGDHCSISGCGRPGAIRGLCRRHYDHWWKARREGRIALIAPMDAPGLTFAITTEGCGSRCDLMWLAGLLEGEGTFSLTARPPESYPVISVEMCAEDIVRRAARILKAPNVRRRVPVDSAWSLTFVA
jgi:hypothetical protein